MSQFVPDVPGRLALDRRSWFRVSHESRTWPAYHPPDSIYLTPTKKSVGPEAPRDQSRAEPSTRASQLPPVAHQPPGKVGRTCPVLGRLLAERDIVSGGDVDRTYDDLTAPNAEDMVN